MGNSRAVVLVLSSLALTLAGCSIGSVVGYFPGRTAQQVPAGQSVVEITAEPSHHLALTNAWVRVFKVEAPPRASTLVHRHRYDYVWVAIGPAEITNEVEGKAPATAAMADGDVRYVPGGFANKVTNLRATPFRNVTIEILHPKKKPANPEARGMDLVEGGAVHTLFEQNGVRASDVLLNPGARLPGERRGRPRLLVAVSALELRRAAAGKPGDRIRQQPGDFAWAAGEQELANVGQAPARFVVLEFE